MNAKPTQIAISNKFVCLKLPKLLHNSFGQLLEGNQVQELQNVLSMMRKTIMVGHGGALVESIAFNRRVVGSTPALAAM